MQPLNKTDNNKNVYRFIVWFIAGLFAGIFITYFIVSSKKTTSGDSNTALLLKETDSLKAEFVSLQNVNSEYSSILEKSNLDTIQLYHLDSLNILITRRELGFLEHLDNIEIANSNAHNTSSALLKNIVDGFRTAARQSSALNSIRNSFNIGNTNYSFSQSMLAAMQRELRAKEVELVTAQKQVAGNRDTVSVNRTTSIIPTDSAAGSLITALRRRNDVLATANKKFQTDIQQLRNQTVNKNAQTGVNTNPVSTQSNKYVSEQISLAEADCYLTRADANQIISNARQRTELLQNALKILNPLMNSENDVIRKQVQTKLAELKRIAANNHD